jgi:hypothetical protein
MEARNEKKKKNSYLTTEYAGLSWRGFGYVCRSTTSVISETLKKVSIMFLLFAFLSDADSPSDTNSIGGTSHFLLSDQYVKTQIQTRIRMLSSLNLR